MIGERDGLRVYESNFEQARADMAGVEEWSVK
jgi:hypothetical protein